MDKLVLKNKMRTRRKKRVRAKISGTAECPRVSVFKSNKHFYAQAIDDVNGHTLACVDGCKEKANATVEGVKSLAATLAQGLKAKGVSRIAFDRNGYLYHGVVASFADGLRENGIEF